MKTNKYENSVNTCMLRLSELEVEFQNPVLERLTPVTEFKPEIVDHCKLCALIQLEMFPTLY